MCILKNTGSRAGCRPAGLGEETMNRTGESLRMLLHVVLVLGLTSYLTLAARAQLPRPGGNPPPQNQPRPGGNPPPNQPRPGLPPANTQPPGSPPVVSQYGAPEQEQ